jgi:quercetin dioxygenase-like cupin family protein
MPAFAVALVSSGAFGYAVAHSGGREVEREALAVAKKPSGAPDHTLGLSKVVIPPQGKIALHHHEGTQVAYIERGELSYTVREGGVVVRRGAADENPRVVRRISAGQTKNIGLGDWIVEQPSTIHQAANLGPSRVVLYIATLLEDGAPPSTPVG